jgi:hypothetical protein
MPYCLAEFHLGQGLARQGRARLQADGADFHVLQEIPEILQGFKIPGHSPEHAVAVGPHLLNEFFDVAFGNQIFS